MKFYFFWQFPTHFYFLFFSTKLHPTHDIPQNAVKPPNTLWHIVKTQIKHTIPAHIRRWDHLDLTTPWRFTWCGLFAVENSHRGKTIKAMVPSSPTLIPLVKHWEDHLPFMKPPAWSHMEEQQQVRVGVKNRNVISVVKTSCFVWEIVHLVNNPVLNYCKGWSKSWIQVKTVLYEDLSTKCGVGCPNQLDVLNLCITPELSPPTWLNHGSFANSTSNTGSLQAYHSCLRSTWSKMETRLRKKSLRNCYIYGGWGPPVCDHIVDNSG